MCDVSECKRELEMYVCMYFFEKSVSLLCMYVYSYTESDAQTLRKHQMDAARPFGEKNFCRLFVYFYIIVNINLFKCILFIFVSFALFSRARLYNIVYIYLLVSLYPCLPHVRIYGRVKQVRL